MGTRSIKEYLASGEATNIKVGETLTFAVGEDGSKDKMFLRSNENGDIIGYIAPDQDIEWVVYDNTDKVIGDTETLLLSLTVDHDISTENGSFAFSCKVKNGSSNKAENITFVLRDGGGEAIASKMVSIDKGEESFPATFWGKILQNHVAGSEFNIYAYGNNDSIARGALTPTAFKIIEAQAAPVTMSVDVLDGFDWNLLPTSEPTESGKLWVKSNGSLKVSQ